MFRLFRLDPPNGWRHVWWELGIVTVGVLLALVAQQVVEGASWRAKAIDSKARIIDELKDHYAELYEQASVTECLDQQLGTLARTLEDGGRPPVFQDEFYGRVVFRAPHRDYPDTAWTTSGAEGVLPHLDRSFSTKLSRYHSQLESLRRDIVNFETLERELGIMTREVDLPRDVRLDLVRQLEMMRSLTSSMSVNANQLLRLLIEAGITVSDSERRVLLPKSRTTDFCRSRGLPITAPDLGIDLS